MDVWNSFRNVVSNGDHHGWALIEGHLSGVWALRSATRVFKVRVKPVFQ